MTQTMMDHTFAQFRARVQALLKSIHALASDIDDPDLAAVVSDIRDSAGEPFLFVVVGEIKAGKSSLINALLGDTICPVDPAPCTDMVQKISYGETETQTDIGADLRQITLPKEILRQVAIVDTPGTNTIMEHHQAITEQFIPSSDLVLFAFPAKNPHTRSAWDLFDLVSEQWRKRAVFILQQIDLTTEDELATNREMVEKYAQSRGVEVPRIFPVSALWELAGDGRSGFDTLRTFIRETVTGGRHYVLKLQGILETTEEVLMKIYRRLKAMEEQLALDRDTADRVNMCLEQGRKDVDRDVVFLVDQVLGHYDRAADGLMDEVADGFSVVTLFRRAFSGLVRRRRAVTVWLESIVGRFEQRLSTGIDDIVAESGASTIASVQRTANDVGDLLTSGSGSGPQPVAAHSRDAMLTAIREKVTSAAADARLAESLNVNPNAMSATLLGGSALTVVGAVMATTHIALVDVTGGILTGLGVLVSGGVIVFKRGRILRDVRRVVDENRTALADALHAQLGARFHRVIEDIRTTVAPFFEDLDRRRDRLAPWLTQGSDLQAQLGEIEEEIEALGSDDASV